MATPSYLGAAQPITSNGGGWLSRLGSYLGGAEAPAYAGDGQPPRRTPEVHFAGLFAAGTPVYRPAPAKTACESTQSNEVATPACAASTDEPAVVACPIDPAALAAGHIAIVIPRAGT